MPAMNSPALSLDSDQILLHCTAQAQAVVIDVVQQTGSTNSDLLDRLARLTGAVVLVAEHQTAGRGRAGRSWLSGAGASLTFSVAWPFSRSPQALLGLPLAVGVALAEALTELQVPVQLKWPNDVLKNGKKLAGVLVETATLGPQTWAVIGIGLNLLMPQELEQSIGHEVADATWLAQMDRNRLLAILLNHLVAAMAQFERSGLSAFLERWNALHAHRGQFVNLIEQGKIIRQGIATGVNHQGCLMLQDEHGVLSAVMAGDVSLRTG
jgi:BirA family biotin operon repressor/biotin-[acetyl-CoA-carboxylase] ligase